VSTPDQEEKALSEYPQLKAVCLAVSEILAEKLLARSKTRIFKQDTQKAFPSDGEQGDFRSFLTWINYIGVNPKYALRTSSNGGRQ
jgi:hypothetical protein